MSNALKQLTCLRCDRADDNNALQTAKRSLKEWQKLRKEIEEKPYIMDMELYEDIKKHIARIEA